MNELEYYQVRHGVRTFTDFVYKRKDIECIQISCQNPIHLSDRSKILHIFTKDPYFDRNTIFW